MVRRLSPSMFPPRLYPPSVHVPYVYVYVYILALVCWTVYERSDVSALTTRWRARQTQRSCASHSFERLESRSAAPHPASIAKQTQISLERWKTYGSQMQNCKLMYAVSAPSTKRARSVTRQKREHPPPSASPSPARVSS